MSDIRIDDSEPLPIHRPGDVGELAEQVRAASAMESGAAIALYPIGGGTGLMQGCRPARAGKALDLTGLDQIIDYPARDMTITVQSGITLARLAELLKAEHQRLPIDVPCGDRATLGGVLACNTSGSRRLGYGTLRDYLLGFSAINNVGEEFKAGGRVVKNVAGYDLGKLMIGALGTLGILTQATLKVRPLPEESALVTLECAAGKLGDMLNQLHNTRTRPVCLDVLSQGTARSLESASELKLPGSDWTLVLGFEGTSEAVHWQVQQLVREMGAGVPLEVRVGFTDEPLWQALVEQPAWPDAVVTLKANLLPSGVAEFCEKARNLTIGDSKPLLQAHAGNGIVIGHYGNSDALARDALPEAMLKILNEWRSLAGKHQGKTIVLNCPPAWKTPDVVWGPPGSDAGLMRAVKEKFDPKRLFNPGRYLGGL